MKCFWINSSGKFFKYVLQLITAKNQPEDNIIFEMKVKETVLKIVLK